MSDTNDLSGIISKLTENPEMMKSLMGIAGNLMGENKPSCDREPEKEVVVCRCDDEPLDKKRSCGEDNDSDRGKKRRGNDAENLIRLLLALKPYVSRERCEKIDGIVKILKLVQLSEKSGLLKSLI